MKHHLHTSIVINTNLETAWNTFTDFDTYPTWETFIKSIKGDIKVGNTIEVEITNMVFKPRVEVFKPNTELTWLGSASLPHIFDGRHSFKFVSNPDGTTTFIHEERFRGLLAPLMKKKLKTEILEGFKNFNETLKKQAELRKA